MAKLSIWILVISLLVLATQTSSQEKQYQENGRQSTTSVVYGEKSNKEETDFDFAELYEFAWNYGDSFTSKARPNGFLPGLCEGINPPSWCK